jgi:Zn-dependent peptidase ImmA (M78 family)
MPKRVMAIVKPEMLAWGRESAGLSVEEAAAKASVSGERLAQWEQGTSIPTLGQVRTLSVVYKRPLAAFFLPEPPRDPPPIHDFRRMSEQGTHGLGPELRVEIRKAIRRRRLALELLEETNEVPSFQLRADLNSDREQTAEYIRHRLGITYESQATWTGNYGLEAFSNWRAALERASVLVFQARGIGVNEMRGFSVGETPLPVVVVNIKDAPAGRTFSMLHEFVHILLHSGGLCDLGETAPVAADRRMEIFCNHVAGAVLVPRQHLLQESIVQRKVGEVDWTDTELEPLARHYGVSPEAVLRRLLICGRTTEVFYREKRQEFLRRYAELRKRRRKGEGGFAPPDVLAIATAGRPFVRLVLTGYNQERISATDVSDFLGVRLKHLAKIEGDLLVHQS